MNLRQQNPIVLSVRDLSFSYRGGKNGDIRAVRDLSFDVEQGSITAVVGPNGSGKSTLFRLFTGLEQPGAGEILLLGSRPDSTAVRAKVATVFQSPALDPQLTVFENLWHHGLLYGKQLSRDTIPMDLLTVLGLANILEKKVLTLSGGFQRRVELAKAMITRPEVLMLDEPLSGLDASARSAFIRMLQDLAKGRSLSVILVTHDLEIAEICDRVLLLENGMQLAYDSPASLLSDFGSSVIEVRIPDRPDVLELVRAQPGASIVQLEGNRILILGVPLSIVAGILDGAGADVQAIESRKPSLEDFFIVRTRREYRQNDLENLAA